MRDGGALSVSVVIVTYRRLEHLARCIESLARQTVTPKEVIVVDNGAQTNDDAEQLCAEAPSHLNVFYVASTTNSLTSARNLGVRRCSYDFVALIDDDVRLAPDYLREILEVFQNQPNAVGVQGYIEPPEWSVLRNRLQSAFGLYHFEPDACRVLPTISTTYPAPLTRTIPCEWISGSNQVYRRYVLLENPWDERLSRYADGEDLDHSFRIHQLYPGRQYITPKAGVEHDESPKGRSVGYELVAMREAYGLYLLRKLFPGSPRACLYYAWSRVGRLVLAAGVAVTGRRSGAWREVWLLIRAYVLVIRNAREFGSGRFEKFQAELPVDRLADSRDSPDGR